MPNYCWNHVTVTGNKKELDKIYRKFNKYKDCNYFTAFGDFILGKGKIDDDYEAIKDRHGDNFDNIYVYGTNWWEFEMNMENDGNDAYLAISGDSAWSPPIELLRSVCKHFKVHAHIEYEEPGCDFGGVWEDLNDDCWEISEVQDSFLINDPVGREFNDYFGLLESREEWRADEENDPKSVAKWKAVQGAE